MCFLSNSRFLTKNREEVEVQDLNYFDQLIDRNGNACEIVNIYKLNEYKVVKMVQISENGLGSKQPTRKTYLKPNHYLIYENKLIKACDLVDRNLAQYEKYHVLNFYLINVKPSDKTKQKQLSTSEGNLTELNSFRINEFVNMNGILISVYNSYHPLNNRFHSFTTGGAPPPPRPPPMQHSANSPVPPTPMQNSANFPVSPSPRQNSANSPVSPSHRQNLANSPIPPSHR